MKAYYIHWNYSASADDQLYYSGEDDKRLFHHKENAINTAQEYLADLQEKIGRFAELRDKAEGEWYGEHSPNLSPEEEEEYIKLAWYYYNDTPVSYTICERIIAFEDKE